MVKNENNTENNNGIRKEIIDRLISAFRYLLFWCVLGNIWTIWKRFVDIWSNINYILFQLIWSLILWFILPGVLSWFLPKWLKKYINKLWKQMYNKIIKTKKTWRYIILALSIIVLILFFLFVLACMLTEWNNILSWEQELNTFQWIKSLF